MLATCAFVWTQDPRLAAPCHAPDTTRFSLQGQVRLSKKMLDPEKPQLGMIDRWYHPPCFVKNRDELGFRPEYSASQLKGFSLLSAEDKEALKKQLPAVKSEG